MSDSADKDYQGELRTLTRVSRQHQDGSWHTHELEIRTAKPPGMEYDEAAALQFQAEERILKMLVGVENPDPGPALGLSGPAAAPEDPLAAMLNKVEWKLYHPPHRAGWIFTDKAPKALADILEKGPASIGLFSYKFSGPSEAPKRFVSRAPLEEA